MSSQSVRIPQLGTDGGANTMAPKKYCCSDSPQTESQIWAIFDIVCACLILFVLIYFTVTVKTDKEFLQAIIDSNRENERDLSRFLEYSPLKQELAVSVAIIRELFSILLGALLYFAARRREHKQVKIWLGSTFVAIIVDLFLFIPKMAFTQNKFVYVSTMIGYFLYKWYEVWMVTLLFKEIRQEEADAIIGETNASYDHDGERSDLDKPPEITNNTHHGIIKLSQPPRKKNVFQTRSNDITIVQTKSPVQVEQIQSLRY